MWRFLAGHRGDEPRRRSTPCRRDATTGAQRREPMRAPCRIKEPCQGAASGGQFSGRSAYRRFGGDDHAQHAGAGAKGDRGVAEVGGVRTTGEGVGAGDADV